MKTAKIYLLFLFVIGIYSCNQQKQQNLVRKQQVDSVLVLDLLNLQTNKKLGTEILVSVENDPVYHHSKKYKAVKAVELIQREIDLTQVDIQNTKIVFECIDGYQPEMPLDLFLRSNAYLAFQDVNAPLGSNWEKIIKDGNEMDAAPFYLVYTDDLENDSRYKWPYNLIKIHLKSLNESKKELFPSEDEKVISGYDLFQNQCITCHSINAIGGKMGPELNFPKSVTEYWKESELVAFIVSPAAFRNDVKMPTLGITKQESQEIVNYLKYMSKRKKKK